MPEVNVSSSENITATWSQSDFQPSAVVAFFPEVGEGYGRLWAGKDATFALATLSLKPEDVPWLKLVPAKTRPLQHMSSLVHCCYMRVRILYLSQDSSGLAGFPVALPFILHLLPAAVFGTV